MCCGDLGNKFAERGVVNNVRSFALYFGTENVIFSLCLSILLLILIFLGLTNSVLLLFHFNDGDLGFYKFDFLLITLNISFT